MYAYTDSSFDEIQGVIGKYAGIIVISKEGGNRQIILDQKDHYQTGWMTAGAFSNCLLYDGRDKQVIADGVYDFYCGYADDEQGGAAMDRQTELSRYQRYTMEIQYISDDDYWIKNQQTGKYLTVRREKKKSTWIADWKDNPDETYSRFHFSRNTGSFALQNVATGMFVGQNEKKQLVLQESRQDNASHWRISAPGKMLNTAQPMVVTQYDPQWCGTPYGGGGSMGTAGCGVLATVNAVYALSGQYMDVMELADYAVEKNYRIVGSGTDDGIFQAACKKYGKKYNFAWDRPQRKY